TPSHLRTSPFSFKRHAAPPHLHPSPTRRSSDLTARSSIATMSSASRRPFGNPARSPPRMPSALGLDDGGIATFSRSRSANRLLRSEEHTSELQSLTNLVCRLLLENKIKSRTDLI